MTYFLWREKVGKESLNLAPDQRMGRTVSASYTAQVQP